MTTYIFLDDLRDPPKDGNNWIVVRTVNDAWHQMVVAWHTSNGQEKIVMSLDHDLGDPDPSKEGYALILKVEQAIISSHEFRPNLELYVHSQNNVGGPRMVQGIQSIYRLLEK